MSELIPPLNDEGKFKRSWPVYYHELEQGTDEWLATRKGVLTASNMKLVITPTLKAAKNDKARAIIHQLVADNVTDFIEPNYSTFAMMRGHEEEIEACCLYSEKYSEIKECGFITNDKWGFTLGYSPDGLVNDDGLVEVKSRMSKHQAKTIISNEVPDEYMMQLQTGLLVSERKWIDFISYSGGMPMFVKRVLPDPEIQTAIIEATSIAYEQVNDMLKQYNENSKDLHPTLFKQNEEIEL